DESRSRCAVMAYDYTVLAGTQGVQNHRKKDRLFELAADWRLPVVFFTEGGGGRPGDTDGASVAGLDCWAFNYWGRLSGLVPLVDTGSVLELRRHFGLGMVTALIRIEGRPLGVVANDPSHLAGAIDRDGADKAARFMQLCDAFDLPLLLLCDTPGMMVGPEAEKTALVRHVSRLFVVGANLTVPFFTIVLRKGYGLGAQAMAGGSFKAPIFTVAWPTGEFGGMGLEGAVKLGFRRELEAVEEETERQQLFDEMVARMYEHGKALSTATYFEIDDVID